MYSVLKESGGFNKNPFIIPCALFVGFLKLCWQGRIVLTNISRDKEAGGDNALEQCT